MRWFLLAAVFFAFGRSWFWEGRELHWSVRVRCEDARGQPVPGVWFQVLDGKSCMGADESFDGAVYTVEFRKGHLDCIENLLGSGATSLWLHATSPAHGRLRKALSADEPLRIVFPDPAWLTVTIDPVPSETDRAEWVLVVWGCGPEKRFWPGDRDLSEHMAKDGTVRVGRLVPGGYHVSLVRKQPMEGGGYFTGVGCNHDGGPDISFESGENHYVLRS